MKRETGVQARLCALLVLVNLLGGCQANRIIGIEDDVDLAVDGGTEDAGATDEDLATQGCRGYRCQLPSCTNGTTTEIVGKLLAPNGVDPIPGATVFVPVEKVPEYPTVLTCDLCNNTPPAIATTTTAFDGSFRLRGTPAGTFPVAMRLGRFQRVVNITAQPCVENKLPTDVGTGGKGARLPRKTNELGVLDRVPRVAVVSGDHDQIECVLKRVGLDELDMYNGRLAGTRNPPPIAESSALLADEAKLLSYQIVIVNCTDNQYQSLMAVPNVKKNVEKFVRQGGRLYVTDWAYDVIEQVPEFSPYVCFEPQAIPGPPMCLATPERATAADSRAFYGGNYQVLDDEMARWLAQFPAVINARKEVDVQYSFIVVNKVNQDPLMKSKVWLQGPAGGYGTRPQTVTFDYKGCGRVHFSTYNTEPAGTVDDGQRWPNNCKTYFTPQERLLEFLFFNIAACLEPPG